MVVISVSPKLIVTLVQSTISRGLYRNDRSAPSKLLNSEQPQQPLYSTALPVVLPPRAMAELMRVM